MSENKPGVGAFVTDTDANAAVADISAKRTMYVGKLTQDPAMRPEKVDGLTNVEAVFDHFDPKVDVEYEDAEGGTVKETLSFSNLGDFGVKGITKQSDFLTKLASQAENYQAFLRQLKSNKILQRLLADPDAKAAYVAALETMLAELASAKEEQA